MFRSFFFAGFECATGYNALGDWFDQVAATRHDEHAEEDYRRLSEVGIHASREAVRWPLVDRGNGEYDFSSVEPFIEASGRYQIEVIWDLFHYGYPDGLDLFSDDFPERFSRYCEAVTRYLLPRTKGTLYLTPINEPSFFAWASADVGRFAPHCHGKGMEMKIALARAAIQGINAIRTVAPQARIVNVDPLCRVVAPVDRPDLMDEVRRFNDTCVFESWDMLAGKLHPELGGSRAHLDIVGMNYYWTNQWELGGGEVPLEDHDDRRAPLRDLVKKVAHRYGGDLLITETAHVDDMRPVWLRYVAEESEALLNEGIPLRGVCLYPILGMPEWHARDQWTLMGLWDLTHGRSNLARKICEPMVEVLQHASRRIEHRYDWLARRASLAAASPL